MVKGLIYKNEEIIKVIGLGNISEELEKGSVIWLDLNNPEEEEVKLLKELFKFHPLAIEDCIHRVQRPKVDNYRDYYFLALKAFKGRDIKKGFLYSDIYIFLGKNYMVTIRWSDLEVMDRASERITSGVSTFKRGIDFVLYTILDEIIDDYFPLTDRIGDSIDTLEELILKHPKRQIQDEILHLKRVILRLRKILSPQREVLNILLRHDFELIAEENRVYYMDVYDHALRLFDLIDTYHDLLTGTLDLYMTQISNRMNEVMKVLTIITTVMMPISVISGIYGMNFQYIPGIQSRAGFSFTVILMLVIVAAEIIYFKVKKWL